VANVFGFGVDEDEDEEGAKRELELAARSKRAKLSIHGEVAIKNDPREGGTSSSLGSASGAAKRPIDMCQQLMKMAEWKRQCGGKRLPMPKDLELQVAKAMGNIG